jgi:pimeloyl-ACP methyl ester carboxylesterase
MNESCHSAFQQSKSSRRLDRKSNVREVEHLEQRLVPAAVCDLAPTSLIISPLTSGETATVQTRIENFGPDSSKAFRVEYRLSLDATLDGNDILLKRVKVKGLAGGAELLWNQAVTIRSRVTPGQYFLGIVLDPRNRVPESSETNNSLTTAVPVTVMTPRLSGQVGTGRNRTVVSIAPAESSGVGIDPSRVTWIVIHGRNGSSEDLDLVQLANVIDGYQAGDQVLMLDWSQAADSGALGGAGENFIQPVAAWAATALRDYGFDGQNLNLVGYSWGSYVAAEMAERLGQVNSILSIEAARDYPGGSYNPEAAGEVDFNAHAKQSWAFLDAADIFGSALTTSTADEAFLSFGSDHFKAVELVTDLLNPPQASPIANVLPLSRLLTGLPLANWSEKSYGVMGELAEQGALFDAIIQTIAGGLQGESLRYFDGQQEQTVAV